MTGVYDTPRYILPSISRGRVFNRINKTHWPFRQTILFSWRGYFERATRGESATISVVGKNGTRLRFAIYLSVAAKHRRNTSSRHESDIGRRVRQLRFHFRLLEKPKSRNRDIFSIASDSFYFQRWVRNHRWFRFFGKGLFLLAFCSSISERKTIVEDIGKVFFTRFKIWRWCAS